jgi:hypothetical protein
MGRLLTMQVIALLTLVSKEQAKKKPSFVKASQERGFLSLKGDIFELDCLSNRGD